MHPTNHDWQLLIGGVLIGIPLMIQFFEWVAKPKKSKGRGATRPKQKP